jgi:hypothetical protein
VISDRSDEYEIWGIVIDIVLRKRSRKQEEGQHRGEEKSRVVEEGEETLNKKEEGKWGFRYGGEACYWLLLQMEGIQKAVHLGEGSRPG